MSNQLTNRSFLRINQIFLLGCIFLLNACTLLNPPTPSQPALDWNSRVVALNQLNAFTVEGSSSIQKGYKTDLIGFTWAQQQKGYNILLYGPLGLGQVTVTGEPGKITLIQNGKSPITAATPEMLLQSQFGWYVPVSNLYYWIRGLPVPSSKTKETFDSRHRLSQLEQENWKIIYLEYVSVGSLELPKKIEISSGDLKIKWVIRQWLLK